MKPGRILSAGEVVFETRKATGTEPLTAGFVPGN
jgi:hypothetical protein